MYLLGRHLPDNKILRITLTAFFGIGYATARRLCARLSVHENAKITDLSEAQINQLSAYLSAPGSIPARKMMPTTPDVDLLLSSPAPSSSTTEEPTTTTPTSQARTPPSQRAKASEDPLRSIVIEADLRRQIIANITHHRTVGSYVGRRHAQGLPVRGQGTRSNALTAKKLNRIERRAYSTGIAGRETGSQGSVSSLVAGLAKLRFGGLP